MAWFKLQCKSFLTIQIKNMYLNIPLYVNIYTYIAYIYICIYKVLFRIKVFETSLMLTKTTFIWSKIQ